MALQSVVCFYSSRFWFLLTQWFFNAAIMRISFRVVFAVMHDLQHNNQRRQCSYVRAKLPHTPFLNAFILTSYNIMPCNSIHREKEDIDSFQPLSLRYFLFRKCIFSLVCLGCRFFPHMSISPLTLKASNCWLPATGIQSVRLKCVAMADITHTCAD